MSVTRDLFAPEPSREREIASTPKELAPRQYAVQVLEAPEADHAAVLESVPAHLQDWVRYYVAMWLPLWRAGWRPRRQEDEAQ